MPRIADETIVGNKAVASVTSAFIGEGFACDRIATDFGEDLMVQPQYKNIVDPFRIYVQVKARGHNALDSGDWTVGIYVDKAHLIKWIRSPELVVVILWMEADSSMRFCVPRDLFSEWELMCSDRKGVTLKFTAEFSKSSIPLLVWKARIDHYNRLLANIQSRSIIDIADEEQVTEAISREEFALVLDFLSRLHLLEKTEAGLTLSDVFKSTFMDILAEGISESISTHITKNYDALALCLILKRIHTLAPNVAVPSMLLLPAVKWLQKATERLMPAVSDQSGEMPTDDEIRELQDRLDDLALRTKGQ